MQLEGTEGGRRGTEPREEGGFPQREEKMGKR